MTPIQIHFTIPFTRIIILCALVSIISSLIALHHAWCILIPMLILALMFAFKSTSHFTTTFLCILAAISIFIRIHNIQRNFQRDFPYLNKPLMMRGTIQHVQHNTQDRAVTTVLMRTDTMHTQEIGTLYTPKTVSVQIPYKRAQRLEPGQIITLYNISLQQPPLTTNLQDNPYRLYLIREGIWASAYISSEVFLISPQSNQHWYQRYLNYLAKHFTITVGHLYNPLFLGKKEKDKLSLRIQHQSLYWGIAHHMARSGLHLVTLLGLCITILHYARIRSRFRFGLYATLITGYALITIPSISFIRSMIMIMIQMFSKLNGFQYSGVHAFALTTLIVVQYNPFHVLFLDFQLSFGITAVIVWLFYVKWTKIVAFPLTSLARS